MSWAVEGTAATRANMVTSIYLEPDLMEQHVRKLEAKYKRCEREAVRFEEYQTAGAEIILVGYGITARILKAVVEQLRAEGLPVGLLRPITLYPFPVAGHPPPRRAGQGFRSRRAQHRPDGRRREARAQRHPAGRVLRPRRRQRALRRGGRRVVRNIAAQYAVAAPSAEPLEVAHV